jgi:hypothetical protein
VGFKGPLLLDSGGDTDPQYTQERGYGYLDGQASAFCGTEPSQTLRADADGQVQYRFDHLLPGHYYHLDVTRFECDGLGRQETILVDGFAVTGQPENLVDGQVHELSVRLDPAFYKNDRTITVSIQETRGYDAVVARVSLHDVDYHHYQLHLTFYQGAGGTIRQTVAVDSVDTGTMVELDGTQRVDRTVDVPAGTYTDGSIVVRITRTNATAGAFVNEIALEELTRGTTATPGCDLAGNDGVITAEDIQAEAGHWRETVGAPYDRDNDNRLTVKDIM